MMVHSHTNILCTLTVSISELRVMYRFGCIYLRVYNIIYLLCGIKFFVQIDVDQLLFDGVSAVVYCLVMCEREIEIEERKRDRRYIMRNTDGEPFLRCGVRVGGECSTYYTMTILSRRKTVNRHCSNARPILGFAESKNI